MELRAGGRTAGSSGRGHRPGPGRPHRLHLHTPVDRLTAYRARCDPTSASCSPEDAGQRPERDERPPRGPTAPSRCDSPGNRTANDHEDSGRNVAELGDGVQGSAVGTRVFAVVGDDAPGGYAEYASPPGRA